LGGQLAVLFASEATTFCSPADPRASTPVAGIVMVAAGMPYFACWPARAAATIAVGSQLAALTARLLGYFPGQSLGFGQREARTLMRDWALTARSGRYALRGAHFDYERALAGVELPILSVALERDEMSPPRAVEHLLAKMPRARITRWSYLPADGNPVSHNRWPRQPRAIVARIAAWHEGLSSRVQSAPRGENVSPIPRP
jgi:predicted alpha/beta hydrolase